MSRNRLCFAAVSLFVAVALGAPSAQGSIVQALSLEELVEHADCIALGRVLFSESFQYPGGEIGTWYRIQVQQDIGGNAPDTEVIVETLGGRVGNLAMQVEGEPSFSVGERVIVFLSGGGPYAAFRAVGMGQGVMRVRNEGGIETVTQSRHGMMLVRRSSDGSWQKSLGALPKEERLEDFVQRLRAIVKQRAGRTP